MNNNIVFLSHSSKTPEALEAIRQFRAALQTAKFEVRFDDAVLKPGDPWREDIDTWMGECGAAFVLLSSDAVESDYVAYEASIVSWRRRQDKRFKLFPVLLGGVDDKTVKEGRFAPLQIGELQLAKGKTLAELTPKLLDVLGPPPTRSSSPVEKLANAIAGLLSTMTDIQLENMAESLELELPPWKPGRGWHDQLVRTLAWRIVYMGIKQLPRIIDALALTPTVNSSSKKDLVDLIAAFWVRPEATEEIPKVFQRKPSIEALALNGCRLPLFTARAYVRRAFWPKQLTPPKVVNIDGGSGLDYASHIERALTQYAKRYGESDYTKWLRQIRPPVFILIPPPLAMNPQELEQLRERFNMVTFIIGTGNTLPPNLSDYAGLVALLPALNIDEEIDACDAFQLAHVLLDTPLAD